MKRKEYILNGIKLIFLSIVFVLYIFPFFIVLI
ncbi:carbohydrate ABC transporter permease, partial [Thermoanaerobacterium thermosaccharolyticum]|nr:carbohydrate ABC transporter permease [Thermoanaerobacterium thermosaccharolyticum]MBE0229360.1 carbohydrate ABC transporter permease [Thermoanaerobacterium thermosaccharolyticum]